MLIHETKSGDKIYRKKDTLIIKFPFPQRIVGTSFVNGGYRENIEAVFNNYIPPEKTTPSELPGGSVENYYTYLMDKFHLPKNNTAGLITSAKMENASIKTASFKELSVTAVVTAGVDVNGGRVGETAFYYEEAGNWQKIGGTINTILLINGNLEGNTLIRAVITATEAKTAALQELVAPSCYSSGIATGSGTDGIIVVSNKNSPHSYTDAGKHSKLGELIGITVKEAVKEALDKETGLNPKNQCDFFERLKRYGITKKDFLDDERLKNIDEEKYLSFLKKASKDEELVSLAASLLYLLDEYNWGLLSRESVLFTGSKFIEKIFGIKLEKLKKEADPQKFLLKSFIDALNTTFLKKIKD